MEPSIRCGFGCLHAQWWYNKTPSLGWNLTLGDVLSFDFNPSLPEMKSLNRLGCFCCKQDINYCACWPICPRILQELPCPRHGAHLNTKPLQRSKWLNNTLLNCIYSPFPVFPFSPFGFLNWTSRTGRKTLMGFRAHLSLAGHVYFHTPWCFDHRLSLDKRCHLFNAMSFNTGRALNNEHCTSPFQLKPALYTPIG